MSLQLRAEGEGAPGPEGEEAGGAEEQGGAAPPWTRTRTGTSWWSRWSDRVCLQVPQFKAQLLPDFSTVVLPEKKKPDPTKPEPFKLLMDERGADKTTRWEEMVPQNPGPGPDLSVGAGS